MPSGQPVVFLVDDDSSVRRALQRLLRAHALDVQTFASAAEFLLSEPQDRASCLVLDLQMPDQSGLELQTRLARAGFHAPVIFLTAHGSVLTSVRAMKAGAVDFLEKPVDDVLLLATIHRALERDRKARSARAARREIERRVGALTDRERDVFELVVTGMLNKQIAHELGIVEKTVKVHRGRVRGKMEAGSLAQLVQMAEGRKAGDPEPPAGI